MNDDIETIHGSCDCRGVRFRVRLTNGLHTARRCNCSYCRMRGAVAVSAALAHMSIMEGAELLTCYPFGTMTAKHYFCSRCGIYTYRQRRSNPAQYGVNVACLDGLSPFDFAELPGANGIEHPRDRDDRKRAPLAGVLRFEPAEPDQ